ncbi:MAG: hypothetical protein P4L40_14880, partial [Terracidiphilus sp.]|nr:hypothetical protein [Terracidiphilus sp.]
RASIIPTTVTATASVMQQLRDSADSDNHNLTNLFQRRRQRQFCLMITLACRMRRLILFQSGVFRQSH